MDAYELGQFIRKERKNKGYTQAELADKVGVSRHTIMQLETNTFSDLGIRKVINILSQLELSLVVTSERPKRPTLEDMFEENAREREQLQAQVRKSK